MCDVTAPHRRPVPLLAAAITLAVAATGTAVAALPTPAAAQANPPEQGIQFGQPLDPGSCDRLGPVDDFFADTQVRDATTWLRIDLRAAGGVADGSPVPHCDPTAAYASILDDLAAADIRVIGLLSNDFVWGLNLVTVAHDAAGDAEFASNAQLYAERAGQVACDPAYQHVDVWEIWNEPNVQGTHLRPARFAQLLALASARIRDCGSGAEVISGGINPGAGTDDTVPWDFHPVEYLRRVHAVIGENGYGGYTSIGQAVDGIGVHPYVDWMQISRRLDHPCLDAFLGAFQTIGDLAAPTLYITEVGWPITTEETENFCFGFDGTIDEAAQCYNLVQAFRRIRDRWSSRVAAATWFTFQDFPGEEPYGLYDGAGQPRPARSGYLGRGCDSGTDGAYDPSAQQLAWQPAAGATGYQVALAKPADPVFTPKKTLAGTTVALAELDPLLETGKAYVWRVSAIKGGKHFPSPEWEFTYQASRYSYGIQSVATEPVSYPGHRDLPVLFDGVTEHPNYGIISFAPGPIAVVLSFAQPVTLDAFVTAIGGQTGFPTGYRWRVEADPDGDGSYQTVVGEQFSDAELVHIPFPGPVTSRAFRITHERFTGDGVEHIREITPIAVGTGDTGTVVGGVYVDSATPANALTNAFVQVCAAGGGCRVAVTNTDGRYAVSGLPVGSHTVTAFPPAGSAMLPAGTGPLPVAGGATVAAPPIVLRGPVPPPSGTTITSRDTTPEGIPVVFWGEPLTLASTGCSGGTADYQLTRGGSVIRTGPMAEAPAGRYTATIAPLAPEHGVARVRITVQCPGQPPSTTEFDVYIDPSGLVRTVAGTPIPDATVMLYRADSPDGPFGVVPDGSAVMSPKNRTNPDTTDAAGHFGWDVLAGYYRVRASHPGCTAPADPEQPYVDSAVLTIPPPVTDLDLRLDCGPEGTVDDLLDATRQACQQGHITSPLACLTLLTAAGSAKLLIDLGMTAPARAILQLYLTTLDLERGRSIPEPTYQLLRGIAQSVLQSL